MADNDLGVQLFDAGWSQGILLPALPWSVIYNVYDPLSKIAKSAKNQAIADSKRRETNASTNVFLHNTAVAFGIKRQSDSLVIASQDCDIVSNISEEPTIVALRAFITDNTKILRYADGNSSHYFLLDRNRGLVAESSVMVLIEKPVLLNMVPQPGVLDLATKLKFARWVAHRFDRPAFPDDVVGAVVKPILDNLAKMQLEDDTELEVLRLVKEVRLDKIEGKPPFNVRLLFIIPESGMPDNGIALDRFVARMRNWFNPLAARLVAWDALHIYEITVGDYLDTQQIYLDHYSYRGQTIHGLLPSPRL